MDVTRRPSDTWIVDFGTVMSEAEVAFYAAPFAHPRRPAARTCGAHPKAGRRLAA